MPSRGWLCRVADSDADDADWSVTDGSINFAFNANAILIGAIRYENNLSVRGRAYFSVQD